jgi:hypothetical protein
MLQLATPTTFLIVDSTPLVDLYDIEATVTVIIFNLYPSTLAVLNSDVVYNKYKFPENGSYSMRKTD